LQSYEENVILPKYSGVLCNFVVQKKENYFAERKKYRIFAN